MIQQFSIAPALSGLRAVVIIQPVSGEGLSIALMPVRVFCGALRRFGDDVNESGCPVYDLIISANFKESDVVSL